MSTTERYGCRMDQSESEHSSALLQARKGARHLAVLRAIADRTRNGVVVTDRDGAIDWVNAALTRMCGYTVDELRGVRPGPLLQGPATAAATLAIVRAAMAERRSFDFELLNYAKDGRRSRAIVR